MLLKETMIVWTPVASDNLHPQLSGKVEITTQPEPEHLKAHPCSAGSCDEDWQQTDHSGRIVLLQQIASRMVYGYGLDESEVRTALTGIEDIDVSELHISKDLAAI